MKVFGGPRGFVFFRPNCSTVSIKPTMRLNSLRSFLFLSLLRIERCGFFFKSSMRKSAYIKIVVVAFAQSHQRFLKIPTF